MFTRCASVIRFSSHYKRLITFWAVIIFKKINNQNSTLGKYAIRTPLLAAGIWGLQDEPSLTKKEVLLAKADALFDQGKYEDIYQLLNKYRNTNEIEILWRLSRALYKMSQIASDVEGKKQVYEAYDIICTAISINDNHFAVHKWIAILLDKKSEFEGMKERIKQLINVKKHMLRASELNPKDATTLYMLGNWCYSVSELSWYQRKIAAALFAAPPESSFEEGLVYFQRAEEIDPMFYSHNLLMLGKTYLKLKKNDEAIKYLKTASEYIAKSDDDHKAKQEAAKLLSSL